MRSNSNTAATTKAIFKVLQEHIGPELVAYVIIIKSDNFWHKQRAAITSSHKYKFEVSPRPARVQKINQITLSDAHGGCGGGEQ